MTEPLFLSLSSNFPKFCSQSEQNLTNPGPPISTKRYVSHEMFLNIFLLFFDHSALACRVFVPYSGIEPMLAAVELRVLTIGSPGNSPDKMF